MTHHYIEYFNINEIEKVKSFVKEHKNKRIYTDHFTKYSIDLIEGYPQPLKTERFNNPIVEIDQLKTGEWLLFKQEHIDELKEQGHTFPDFTILNTREFKVIFESAGFVFYEKQ